MNCVSILFFILVTTIVVSTFPRNEIPPDWQLRIAQGNMLYAETEPSNVMMMPAVGNGYVSTVVSSNTVYISGVFNGLNSNMQLGPSHRARIPSTTDIEITNASPIGSAIDFEKGVFYRRSTMNNNLCTAVEQRWYAHRENRYLLVHEIQVNNTGCDNPVTLDLVSTTGGASTDILFKQYAIDGNTTAWQGAINITEEPDSPDVVVAYVTPILPATIEVASDSLETFIYITAFRTSLDTDSATPMDDAIDTYNAAVSVQDTLLATHIDAMLHLYFGRMEITGDLQLAQAVNSSLYYIMTSIRDDWPWSLSPGGLASNSYNGHSFWDGETWMYPSLLMLHPDLAQSMIEYRYNHMQGAELKAQSYNKGYQGTMYPWESAFTGQEVCPTSAPTGQLEQHISGDIAFALMQYWRSTHNITWLQTYGYPMLEGIAEFWASRVEYDAESEQYMINGVIPPDEYAVNVNNSVYTNVVAMYSLTYATETAKLLNITPPAEWMTIANNIFIPFDSETQIHPEYEGYSGQLIKQADVVLLGFPLMYEMPEQVRRNDLVYYSERTDPNGPAMTWSMYSVAWLELGAFANASSIFSRSYANIQAPFNVWTETPTGGAVNFITGAGGFLQAVLFGFSGMRLTDKGLALNAVLPEYVTQIKYSKLNFMGSRVDISFNANGYEFTVFDSQPDAPVLYITNAYGTVELEEGVPTLVGLGSINLHI